MPRAREPNLPQHNMDQGHYGELPLEFLPDGLDVGDVIVWNGTTWVVQENAAGDGKVLVSATDPVRAFLADKIIAGENITIGIAGTGVDEKIVIAATGGGSGSSGEQLVADGTSPPEALTNEAGDDWLFEG